MRISQTFFIYYVSLRFKLVFVVSRILVPNQYSVIYGFLLMGRFGVITGKV